MANYKYKIGDFNICSSDVDYDVFFNKKFRAALTKAINYQLKKYKAEHPNEVITPEKLTLFFYPNTVGFWFEIKQSRDNTGIYMIDSMADWLNK